MNIKKIIKEEVNRILKTQQMLSELGEATLPPFKYIKFPAVKYSSDEWSDYSCEIEISNNIKIELRISEHINDDEYDLPDFYRNKKISKYSVYKISFDLTLKSREYLLNKYPERIPNVYLSGFLSTTQTLRLMSTIVTIIKEFIRMEIPKTKKYYYFSFSPLKSGKFPDSRENLYVTYLKKNLPTNWKIEKLNNTIYFYPKLI